METTTEPVTVNTASVKPEAKPISRDELSSVIGKTMSSKTDFQEGKPNEHVPKQDTAERQSTVMPDFRESMRKKVMEKEPAKEADKPEPKTESPAAVEPKSEEEDLHYYKPDTAKRIKFFISETKRLTSEKEAVTKELEEAKKAPKTAVNVEEVTKLREEYQKTHDELTKFRRRYEVDNDPEFQAKYNEPVAAVEKNIENIFRKYKLDDATMKVIKDEGGFASFSSSRKTYPVQEPDQDNPGEFKTVHKTASQLFNGWVNGGSMDVVDAENIKASLGKQQLIKSEAQAAMQKAQDDAKVHFENMSAEKQKAQDELDASNKVIADGYKQWQKEIETNTEWLKQKPIPETASEEEKKALAEENEFSKQLRDGLDKHPKDAKDYAKLQFDAAEGNHLRRTMAQRDAQIERLTAALAKQKGAMKTTNKGGSLLVRGGEKPAVEEDNNSNPTDFMSRINARMKKGKGSDE